MKFLRFAALLTALTLALSACGFSSKRAPIDPSKVTPAESYDFEKLVFSGIEESEFEAYLEAEDGSHGSGVSVKTDDSGSSGGAYVDISDNSGFKLTVDIPTDQFYKITVCHRAGDHKENDLLFNGQKVMTIYSESGGWQENEADGIFLESGVNEITLGSGWSWFSIDYIEIEDGSSISNDVYSGMSETLSNEYANLKTQNIYQYLRAIYGKRTLAGQCTDYGNNTETDALYKGLGKYPAIRTFDFIFDSPSYPYPNDRPAKDYDLAIEWSKDGGLVVYDWHWHAPCGSPDFYAENTTFRLSNAVTDKDLAHMDLEDIKKLYDGGEISEEAYKLVSDIDVISGYLQKLEDNNVTVLWRPLHEASGGWFWWGASGSEPYKWLWRLMYERMTDYHELDNLIWVWNAQDEEWYPGDDYCDIAAIDIYGEAHNYGVSPATLADMSEWSDGEKMVTMSECATMPDPDLIVRDNAYWLWFAVWNWDYIVKDGTPELSDAYTDFDMMKKVYDSEAIITRDELPKF